MALGAIGEELDQRWSIVRPGALGSPSYRRKDRERVIAVDSKPGDPVSDGALSKGRSLGSSDPREARDRPLVIHRREDDWDVVNRSEGHRAVEITLGRGSVAYPAHGGAAVALDRGAHRPADRLWELGREIAGDRKEAVCLVRIHDRQLAAFELVAFVRVDLAHHLRQRIPTGDEQSLLAVRREMHVVTVERRGRGDGDRLLPGALHVEAG